MSLTFDETEKLITEIDERLERLAKIKVKAENIPVPVVRDKYGRLVSDYSLKLWLLKLHEEVLEFEYELEHCCDIDDLPKNEKYSFLSSLLAFIKEKKGEADAV